MLPDRNFEETRGDKRSWGGMLGAPGWSRRP